MQQYRNSHLVVARGAIAQLGERLHGLQVVGGSIPPGSTITPARSARLPPTFLGRRAAAVAMRRVAWPCAADQAAGYGSGTPRGWQSNGDPAFLQRQGGCTEFVS